MKRVFVGIAAVAVVGIVAFHLVAQERPEQKGTKEKPAKNERSSRPPFGRPGGPPPFGGGPFGPPPPPPSPVVEALDANGDGVIDAKEIKNAVKTLKSLDKNKDGKLDHNEIHPPPPFGPGRGPRGRGPRGGPGGRTNAPKALIERLQAFDENKDGKLTKKEVPERMQGRLFEMADKNKDGVIDSKELKELSETQSDSRPRRGPGFRRPPFRRRPEDGRSKPEMN